MPPGWKGELPAGVTRLDVATEKVWLWGRLRLTQGEDAAPVLALQKEFRLTPLSAFGKSDAKPQAASLPPLPDIAGDELGFFTQLGAAVKANPIKPADDALFTQFARIGLTRTGSTLETRPSPAQGPVARASGRALGRDLGLPERSGAAQRLVWATGLDDFGFDYPLRALVSGPYLGGQGEKEAMYPLRYTDSAGKVLTGEERLYDQVRFAPAGQRLLVADRLQRRRQAARRQFRRPLQGRQRYAGARDRPGRLDHHSFEPRCPCRRRREELAADAGRPVLSGASSLPAEA